MAVDACLVCDHPHGLHSPRGNCIAPGCDCQTFVEGPPVERIPIPSADASVVAAHTNVRDGRISVTLIGRGGEELGRLWLDHETARTLAASLLEATHKR